jgi:hypothetical protein
MEARNIFKNLSPLDHRYYLSNRSLFENLSEYLSEEAVVRYCIKVESALPETHIRMQKYGINHIFEISIPGKVQKSGCFSHIFCH